MGSFLGPFRAENMSSTSALRLISTSTRRMSMISGPAFEATVSLGIPASLAALRLRSVPFGTVVALSVLGILSLLGCGVEKRMLTLGKMTIEDGDHAREVPEGWEAGTEILI